MVGHLAQVVEAAAEVLLVHQHGDRPRAGLFIDGGQLHRVHVRKNVAPGRRTALDFGDDTHAGRAQGKAEIFEPGSTVQALLDIAERCLGLP